jgi:hypothetical protein
MLQLDSHETNLFVEVLLTKTQSYIERENELGQREGFHCIPVSMYLVPSSYLCSHCLLLLFYILVRKWG